MADSFGKIVEGINPTSGSGTTEWFTVPSGFQYQGYVRVTYVGDEGEGPSEFSIYGLTASGDTPTDETLEAKNSLDYGDFGYYPFDMGPEEALAVGSDSDRIAFHYRGLKIS